MAVVITENFQVLACEYDFSGEVDGCPVKIVVAFPDEQGLWLTNQWLTDPYFWGSEHCSSEVITSEENAIAIAKKLAKELQEEEAEFRFRMKFEDQHYADLHLAKWLNEASPFNWEIQSWKETVGSMGTWRREAHEETITCFAWFLKSKNGKWQKACHESTIAPWENAQKSIQKHFPHIAETFKKVWQQ